MPAKVQFPYDLNSLMGGRHFCINTAGLRRLAGSAAKIDCLKKTKLRDIDVWPRGCHARRLPRPSLQQHEEEEFVGQFVSADNLQSDSASQWWPHLHMLDNNTPSFEKFETPTSPSSPSSPAEGGPQRMLRRALAVAEACSKVRGTSKLQDVGEFKIECVQEKGNLIVWQVEQQGFKGKFACSEAVIHTDVPLEAFLWALYNMEERMKWDGKSLNSCRQVHPASVVPEGALYDAIYCRMPAPAGMTDRDVVQERFLLALPDDAGFAIVMHSPSEAAAEAFGYPCDRAIGAKKAVRAHTVLSGYLLQPLSGAHSGFKLTVMSQTDLGGKIPAWAQAMTKKVGMQRFSAWTLRLQEHCERRGASKDDFGSEPSVTSTDSRNVVVPKAAVTHSKLVHGIFVLSLLVLILSNFMVLQSCSQKSDG